MTAICVDVALYGTIAKYGGGTHVARLKVEMPPEACLGDLLHKLGVGDGERGYISINAVLADMPGLNLCRPEPPDEGDHVGLSSITHMWPCQYRDGVPMAERVQAAVRAQGALHHTYAKT